MAGNMTLTVDGTFPNTGNYLIRQQEMLTPSAQARAARGWLDEFEGRFAPEDKAQLGGKCKVCRRPRASALRIRRALGLN